MTMASKYSGNFLGRVILQMYKSHQRVLLNCSRLSTGTKLLQTDTPTIPLDEIKRFVKECLISLGTGEKEAKIVADTLAEADYRGHYRHGLSTLETLLEDIESEACRPNFKPKILKETPAVAWVDGAINLGAVVGHFCMNIAIKKAKEVGIGWVTCKGSNYYGLSTCYALQAYNIGFIGFACSNAPAMVIPRGEMPTLGPNSISLAAPGKKEEDGFVMTMCSSTADCEELDILREKGQKLPKSWALDKAGVEAADVSQATYSLPLGGTEDRSGYKGYNIILMIEILCGILAGGKFGPYNKQEYSARDPANLCHTFFALDPNNFNSSFKLNMQDFISVLRSTAAVTRDTKLWIAGDAERLHMKAVDEAGGIHYLKEQLDTFEEIAFKYGVQALRAKDSCIVFS